MRTVPVGFKTGTGSETAADLLAKLGPTLRVDIGLRSRAPPGEPPDLPAKRIRALIDTGAGAGCIDERLAERLRLPISGKSEISGIGGRHDAFIYTARLYVPELDRLVSQSFAGVKLDEGDQWHSVILGRTFLRPYRMNYDGGTGQVEILEE
jgi:hypothetical protein